MRGVTLFFFLFIGIALNAQISLNGVVLDSATQLPVPYSLVVTGSHKLGTVTNEKGEFELSLPDSLQNNYLEISSIGYDTTILSIEAFLKSDKKEVFIKHKIVLLAEVNISSIEQKSCDETLGAKRNHSFGGCFFGGGNEVAVFIPNISQDSGIISTLNFFITQRGFPSTPFRANLYRVNPQNNGPGELINVLDFILSAQKGNEWAKLDVTKYNIAIPKEGFFVSMEWLPDSKNHPYKEEVLGKEFKGDGQILGINNEIKSDVTWFKPFLSYWFQIPSDSHSNAMISADVLIQCK